jgi:hypothetical protein
MDTISPAIRGLAGRLIALEAGCATPRRPDDASSRACERLRVPLAKLVGAEGFRSLMARALAIAKDEDPSLDGLRVRPDGSLEGADRDGRGRDAESGDVVVARLLGLLVTFIGEPLTLRLVRDAWPGESGVGIDAGSGEAS